MGNTHDTEIARIEADHIQTKWRTTDDYRWGYTGDRGPETWWVHYPSASGGMQSPVDIITEEAMTDTDLGATPIQVCYHSGASTQQSTSLDQTDSPTFLNEMKILVNTGNTARVNIVNSRSYISGGPCKGYTYVLEQFHVHWGESDSNGSEHFINSRPYAAEVHLVHWNEDLYGSYEEAVRSDDGIVILAVFVQLSETKSNDAMTLWSQLLEDIVYREQNMPMPKEFPVKALLPDDLNKYWTYQGSFSTPPCYETVTWVVLEKPIWTSAKVLSKFRTLRSYCENETRPNDEFDGQMTSNRRSTQPIGTRKVAYVDCCLFRGYNHQSHNGGPAGSGQPFRSSGGPTLAVRLATFQNYVGKYSGDGLYGSRRG